MVRRAPSVGTIPISIILLFFAFLRVLRELRANQLALRSLRGSRQHRRAREVREDREGPRRPAKKTHLWIAKQGLPLDRQSMHEMRQTRVWPCSSKSRSINYLRHHLVIQTLISSPFQAFSSEKRRETTELL